MGGMDTAHAIADPLDALRRLTPEQLEIRIADLDAERTALSRLLRSLRAGERARRRTLSRAPLREGRS